MLVAASLEMAPRMKKSKLVRARVFAILALIFSKTVYWMMGLATRMRAGATPCQKDLRPLSLIISRAVSMVPMGRELGSPALRVEMRVYLLFVKYRFVGNE